MREKRNAFQITFRKHTNFLVGRVNAKLGFEHLALTFRAENFTGNRMLEALPRATWAQDGCSPLLFPPPA